MNYRFIPLKLLRLYQYWMLHYPLEVFVNFAYSHVDKKHRYVIVYACQTVSRIMLLLHYLAIVWIWIGSE